MLYPTLSQPFVALMIMCCGLLCGMIFDVSNIIVYLSGGDKLSKNIFDFISIIICSFLLFLFNLIFNYGQFRIFILIIFLIFFYIERFFSKVLWTKLFKRCYNKLRLWKTKRIAKKENG